MLLHLAVSTWAASCQTLAMADVALLSAVGGCKVSMGLPQKEVLTPLSPQPHGSESGEQDKNFFHSWPKQTEVFTTVLQESVQRLAACNVDALDT